jgi:hypothetical protein
MRHRLTNLVAIAASLLLALPPGWCCWSASATGREPARLVDAQSIPQSHSCCQHHKAAKTPKQSPATPRLPMHPGQSACCVPQHVVPAKASPASILFAPPIVLPFAAFAASPIELALSPIWFVVHSPPLNILHCVWLC